MRIKNSHSTAWHKDETRLTQQAEGRERMQKQFVTVDDVQKILGVSRSKAYQILQGINRELKAKGYITLSGKCPTSYFKQKFYGLQVDEDDTVKVS